MYLSENLRYWRTQNHLSYIELEILSGVPHNNIHRIETKQTKNPGILSILKLAETMGVTLDILIYEKLESKGTIDNETS